MSDTESQIQSIVAIKSLLTTIESQPKATVSATSSQIQPGFVEIYDERDGSETTATYSTFAAMVETLKTRGIVYEKWDASAELTMDASNDEVLDAYATDIIRIKKAYNFVKADVCQITAENPKKAVFRQKFLREHTHADEEVRFFVDGAACFYLHLVDKKEVVRIECSKGHLLVVPPNAKHWFDMGPNPFFRAIRFFGSNDGWVAKYTESQIDSEFPYYEN